MNNIVWHDVPGYPDVQVDMDARVRSRPHRVLLQRKDRPSGFRWHPAKLLKQSVRNHPSKHRCVFVNSVRTVVGVHVLMCAAFHGASPEGKPFALHRDGVDDNNEPGNLYWGDRFDNAQDAIRHGVMPRGEKHGLAKLTEDAVREIRKAFVKGCFSFGAAALARSYNVAPVTIHNIIRGNTWKHVGV